ncbi:L-histidine N(alpha)-methyltransferase [Acidicapsa ligni]|uniref:L-histidine N(alpha)-methyltransferase n=1 Tax=Acidicapsa ligni TaxID=542300 RepID=UPI0021E0FC61|nr:L-histidine N(alpha)-methyltransferase [Acidicapsa ligni]
MATAAIEVSKRTEAFCVDLALARIVRDGLAAVPKRLPPWLFYDEAGSRLFDEITALPEYYLTRIERQLLTDHAGEMIAAAAGGERLRLVELGAGSADKTRTLLSATLAQQGTMEYRPVDVSDTALEAACERIAAELPACRTTPMVADYTVDWITPPSENADRELLLWIGSSIGNFEPEEAGRLLKRINRTMQPGDGLLLGVDLAPVGAGAQHSYGGKSEEALVAAYDDAAGVTAAFNRNVLVRLNRDLGANFNLDAFAHCAVWNAASSRMEMHLESLSEQWVRIEALDLDVRFAEGERMHTENSYKYTMERAAMLMARAGFPVVEKWTDPAGWFAVFLGRKG